MLAVQVMSGHSHMQGWVNFSFFKIITTPRPLTCPTSPTLACEWLVQALFHMTCIDSKILYTIMQVVYYLSKWSITRKPKISLYFLTIHSLKNLCYKIYFFNIMGLKHLLKPFKYSPRLFSIFQKIYFYFLIFNCTLFNKII